MAYAETTTVSVEKSRAEIEQLLRKHGASAFAMSWNEDRAVIQCGIRERVVRFGIAMPLRADHKYDRRRQARSQDQISAAVAQTERARWRAMLLVIKAKLEAVDLGIETFEEAFLANTVLPSGETMGQWSHRELGRIYESGGELPSVLALPVGR